MVGRRAVIAAALFVLIALAVCLPEGPTGKVAAQNPSFSLAEERANVTVMQDGSVNIDYKFVFTNVGFLDGVDIGMPNNRYDLSTATAQIIVEGQVRAPRLIHDSPYVQPGVAVELDSTTVAMVQGGGSFTLLFHINNPHMVYSDPNTEGMAGVAFTPTWFDPSYQNGDTGLLNASIILPEGMISLSEVTYLTNQPYDGLYFDGLIGRGVATWEASGVSPGDQAAGAFDVGAGFPKQYVAVYYDPSSDPNTGGGSIGEDLGILAGLLAPLIFISLFVGMFVVAIRGGAKRRSDYFAPQLSVVGAGPRRDLTAPEAAVVLERPLEDIATMILFGLIRKDKVKVVSESYPMRLQKSVTEGEYSYETAYLNAIQPNGLMDRNLLRTCLVGLIKTTQKKLQGFDFNATRTYYKTIVDKAWEQVMAAKTPEEIAAVLKQNNDWMMADRNYEDRMRRTVYTHPVFLPGTWPSQGGIGKVPGFPTTGGGNLAQDYVSKVKGASNNLVNDMKGLARQVVPFTNPIPVNSTSASRSGFSGGGGGHCACACACACAGGGR